MTTGRQYCSQSNHPTVEKKGHVYTRIATFYFRLSNRLRIKVAKLWISECRGYRHSFHEDSQQSRGHSPRHAMFSRINSKIFAEADTKLCDCNTTLPALLKNGKMKVQQSTKILSHRTRAEAGAFSFTIYTQ